MCAMLLPLDGVVALLLLLLLEGLALLLLLLLLLLPVSMVALQLLTVEWVALLILALGGYVALRMLLLERFALLSHCRWAEDPSVFLSSLLHPLPKNALALFGHSVGMPVSHGNLRHHQLQHQPGRSRV